MVSLLVILSQLLNINSNVLVETKAIIIEESVVLWKGGSFEIDRTDLIRYGFERFFNNLDVKKIYDEFNLELKLKY